MSKKTDKKETPWQQHIGTVFMGLIGAVCGILIMIYIESLGDRPPLEELLSLVWLLFGIYLASFVHTIIHEAGHLVFGLLSGYTFISFRIASFMWVKQDDKLRFKRFSLAGMGGQCLMAPPDMRDGKIPVMLYNLGGSLMNIIVGVLFLSVSFLCSGVPFLSTTCLLFAIVGFIVALMNGVPMRTAAVNNDGYNAFALTRNAEAMRSFWVQLKANEQLSKGVRVKDMPDEWFAVPTDEAMKNSMVAVMGVFACSRLMDAENFEEADKLMAHMLEIESGIVGLHRKLLICDRIYIELITKNRKDILEEMLDKEQKKFMKQMKDYPSVLRTEYVYALLSENNIDQAQKLKAQFEKCAKRNPYQYEIQSERELMEKAERLCDAT